MELRVAAQGWVPSAYRVDEVELLGPRLVAFALSAIPASIM